MPQEIELVVFENVSVMHQKALSLPFGKVSLRQLLMLSAGMLSAVIAYSIAGEIVYPAIVFGLFVALGMISTKVLPLDQMIKSVLVFLVKGTSLSKKPQYMIDYEKKRKLSAKTRLLGNVNDKDSQLNSETPAENQNVIEQSISYIENMLGKKSKATNEEEYDEAKIRYYDEQNIQDDNSQEEKRFSIDVKLEENKEDITTKLLISNMQDNYYDYPNDDAANPNILEKLFNIITSKKNVKSNQNELIPEVVTVILNGTKLSSYDYTINEKDDSILIPLSHDSEYSVVVTDENNKETTVVAD